MTPAELERYVKSKIDDGEVELGKPDVPVGGKLVLLDNGCRYGVEHG